ncbi:hypothetical protein DFH09DRAFT_1144915 [Mycena vulgaris]|nr:hypothetical protein DFH09DRAFT_1144915 [Mycena vulgaris]
MPHLEFNCHVVVFTGGLWGHTRPMCSFAARLVKARSNLVISFMTTPSIIEQSKEEVSRFFDSETAKLKDSIQFIALPKGVNFFNSSFEGVQNDFAEAYENLLAQDLPFPAAFVSEFTMPAANEIVRARSRGITKLICWCPTALSAFANALSGFDADSLEATIKGMKAQALQQGKSYQEISYNFLMKKSLQGKIRTLPDLPEICDYELFPQQLEDAGAATPRGEVIFNALQNMTKCDGAIGVTSRVIEPASCALLDSKLGERGASFFALGPIMPDSISSRQREFSQCQELDSTVIQSFLDRMLSDHGENSVLYISFGSILPPLEPEKFWIFVDAVVEKGVPFILSDASGTASLPDRVLAAVSEGGIGLLRKWLPQQFILSHPATGWFLSHCGMNSTLESLAAGVPMICWPQIYDQPVLAINVSQVLGCGFELNEIRRGLGLKYRQSTRTTATGTNEAVKAEARNILEKAFFGADGMAARGKALQISEVLGTAWDEGDAASAQGVASKDLRRFIDEYLPAVILSATG